MTYTSACAPRDAARHPVTRKAVRRTARVAVPSSKNHAEHAREVVQTGQRDNMRRFRVNPRTLATLTTEVAQKQSVASSRRLALDPHITQLGGSAWELLHYCKNREWWSSTRWGTDSQLYEQFALGSGQRPSPSMLKRIGFLT